MRNYCVRNLWILVFKRKIYEKKFDFDRFGDPVRSWFKIKVYFNYLPSTKCKIRYTSSFDVVYLYNNIDPDKELETYFKEIYVLRCFIKHFYYNK